MKKIITFVFLLGSLQGHAQWSNTADNITTGNLTIGSTVADSYSKFTIKGPNQPTGITNKRDISFEFSSAGQAQIRSYRGTSWDTYLQFLTSDYANTGGIPTPRLHINHDGKIGIGTITPTVALDILMPSIAATGEKIMKLSLPDASNDFLSFENATATDGVFLPMILGNHETDNRPALTIIGRVGANNDQGTSAVMAFDSRLPTSKILTRPLFQWQSLAIPYMTLSSDGSLGIGTTDTKGYKLAVAGNMIAEQVTVKLKGNWPDYVFTPSYNLLSLQETEQHIKEKGHLPGIPSAEEVKNNGVDLGEMNAKLLQKIEELTLHLIELKKENESLNVRVNQLENSKKEK
ncbi:hypothetical protein [Solitalea canadensis]|uniref:Uncharacterized protein n=1 Tax=Solitalea canadensis (strain ATCC 29591 / DSM 3403 / JCM 21819 / LMG 8368 / NBRC 15130 / NCIMB 12057 / USAM 9D) TaxID=929556 RepID=H8KTR9_SOLCM|nr:hypothetical protein [Solitalea canadensis]AFD06644.1 hypothetical protein Solca_1571 [Solitalea canadensis DSM 3403]